MEPAKADLMRALGRLVRGLSTLFWGIPLSLAADVETARTDWLHSLGALSFVPALVLSALLWYGLRQFRDFQRQERVWHLALDRAELFAILNIGLTPFLFWWHRFPFVPLYFLSMQLLVVCGFMFLLQVNQVLRRLGAMLPDETLRLETRTFVSLNTWMLSAALGGLCLLVALWDYHAAPHFIWRHRLSLESVAAWLVLFLTLMAVAITLAMLWKIKDALFSSFLQIER